ncbi:DASH complex subunit Dad3-domain-containing protein [Lentinula raphanica]|nr:DASH complex subunit Dad3-domain-containing protein [Lentinula raphanica]KAJ3756916.1 DASH complex subunit Dad3-domain-containing protein [Lentinula raphanica]KAJ3769170.1 DASH complex subunit Dad3-domain-containing protein [Lentinula raphanica]KAJ3827878.1 DASH complex subunit Dad3-domain-containing protein [Lentinula raphanica]
MSDSTPTGNIFEENPYANHASLSPVEAEVLWEYAKLAQNVKLVTSKTRRLMNEPDQMLVSRLRSLETKMGLVMVLFKASVWNVINEQPIDVMYGPAETSADATIRR